MSNQILDKYSAEISEYPLLTAEEEAKLANQIKRGGKVGKKAEEFRDSDLAIGIAMVRDSVATDLSRKSEGIVVYQRKKKKNERNKSKQEDVSKEN